MTGDQRSLRASSNPEFTECETSVGSCPPVLHLSFSCFSGFLVLYPVDVDWESWETVGSASEEFEDNEDGILGYCYLRVLVRLAPGCSVPVLLLALLFPVFHSVSIVPLGLFLQSYSKNIKVFATRCKSMFDINSLARPTGHSCCCRAQY